MPLAVGNQWVMQMDGARDGRTYARIDTFAVVRDTDVTGETWYEVRSSHFPESPGFENAFYANRDDGLWKGERLDDGTFATRLLYAFPAGTGTEYALRDGATTRVVSADSLYRPPAQDALVSYHYRITYTSAVFQGAATPFVNPLSTDHFLAPGTGLVRVSCFWARLNDDGRLERIGGDTWELLEFRQAQ